MVFPLYHVLADAGEFAGAEVLPSVSSHPLAFDGLALRKHGTLRLLLANLTGQAQDVTIRGLPPEVVVRILDEDAFERATLLDPVGFHQLPGEPWLTKGAELAIRLRPYAYARIDGE
jgi:hypothetical protein